MIKSIIKIGVFVGIIVSLIAIVSLLAFDARRRGKISYCQNNLRNLGNLAYYYIIDAKRDNAKIQKRGSEFWREGDFYGEWKKQKVKDLDIFICPLTDKYSADAKEPISIDYRGPQLDPFEYKKNEPIGADKVNNHGEGMGGNVLLMDLSVSSASISVTAEIADSALWKKANETTSK